MTGSRPPLAPDDSRHGTVNGYVNYDCRCAPCVAARADYDARRHVTTQRQIAVGPVRNHVSKLLAGGATKQAIARTAGVGNATLHAIVNGDTRRVQAETAERLLAVTLDECAPRTLPTTERRDWRHHAACAAPDQQLDLWFPTKANRGRKGGDDPAYQAAVRRAKAVCVRCPVADDCLAYAQANRIEHGIWGGFTTAERAELLVGAA